MNFDKVVNKLKETGINISRIMLEGKVHEAYELGYNDPYVPRQATVETIRHNLQWTMDQRKIELFQKNFEGVPNQEDKLEMKSYEFVESILPQIITTDEKDKIPEKGSTSFDAIHEWVEEECAEAGKDLIENQLKEIYEIGRIYGHFDEVNNFVHRVYLKANNTIRSEKEKIYKEYYYEKPTEEALAQMKGYIFIEENLPEIIKPFLEPPTEESIVAILEGNSKNLPSGIIESVAKISKVFSKQINEMEIGENASTTLDQYERNIDLDKIVPPTARKFPPKTKLFATYLHGFSEGVEFGYRIAMLALANNNASKELMHTASQYFRERRGQFDDFGREKIDQEFNEKMHLWTE